MTGQTPQIAPLTTGEVAEAARILADHVVASPLIPFGDPGAGILLKPETLQPGGCFKIRGVFHAVSRLTAEERARGLTTVSAGNTAKALALAGRHFGVPARSLMPKSAPAPKIEAMRAYGGTPELVEVDALFDYLKSHGWEREDTAFIHPWTNRDVMLGHGTMGAEILADCPGVETVFLPVGGGGLLGGVAGAIRAARPDVRIVAVEPEGCAAFAASRTAGHAVAAPCETICDGVAVPYMTDEVFAVINPLVDDVCLVSEDETRAAIRALAHKAHIVAEGSGALALAAAVKIPEAQRGLSVAPVTGGSIDHALLAQILSG